MTDIREIRKDWSLVYAPEWMIEYLYGCFNLNSDVMMWMEENVGSFRESIGVIWTWDWDPADSGFVKIWFKHEEHAILFKMVWA